jgi:phage pi2 protein 07
MKGISYITIKLIYWSGVCHTKMLTNSSTTMKATLLKTLAVLLLAGSPFFLSSCKDNSTEPEYTQEYDSEAAADMNASALGTDAGGAGIGFDDAYTLMTDGNIQSSTLDAKSGAPQTRTKEFDPVTKLHKLVITREKHNDKFSFLADITYTYTFYDRDGNAMDSLIKGITDKIVIATSRNVTASKGERIDVEDKANGTWTIRDILSGTPILKGTYTREGGIVFHTQNNGDRTMNYSLDVDFQDDKIVRKDNGSGKYTYLEGPAESHFEASTSNGRSVVRDTKITFNGDGTATLEITRTSGDGSVDIYTVDVKVGKWLRKGK